MTSDSESYAFAMIAMAMAAPSKKRGRGRPRKVSTLLTAPVKKGKGWKKGGKKYPDDVVRRFCGEIDALKKAGRAKSDSEAIRIKTLAVYRELGWSEAKCLRVLNGDEEGDLNRLRIVVTRFRRKEKRAKELFPRGVK